MILSQPKTSFLGVVFDGDHDFVGPRSPKAHLDTLNAIGNLLLPGGSTLLYGFTLTAQVVTALFYTLYAFLYTAFKLGFR